MQISDATTFPVVEQRTLNPETTMERLWDGIDVPVRLKVNEARKRERSLPLTDHLEYGEKTGKGLESR